MVKLKFAQPTMKEHIVNVLVGRQDSVTELSHTGRHVLPLYTTEYRKHNYGAWILKIKFYLGYNLFNNVTMYAKLKSVYILNLK